jgi:uncharacterized protein YhbP (UPF0306 family)
MEDLNKLAAEILKKGHLMSLGTTDEWGVWVSDVIYIFDEQMNVYWLSDPEVRHSQAVLKDPQVAATITISNNKGEDNVGLQISGRAEKLNGNDMELAKKHAAKRDKAAPTKEGELEHGDSWYKLTPERIDIIYEPLWGFEKKTIRT